MAPSSGLGKDIFAVQEVLNVFGNVEGCQALEGAAQGDLESPSLEVFKEELDMALNALVRVTRWGSVTSWI